MAMNSPAPPISSRLAAIWNTLTGPSKILTSFGEIAAPRILGTSWKIPIIMVMVPKAA